MPEKNMEFYDPEIDMEWNTAEDGYQNQSKNILEKEDAESENNQGFTRREFVIGALGFTAGILAKPAYEKVREIGEQRLEDKINMLLSGKIANVNVPERYGIDHFYARSGWNEGGGCVDSFTYREAVMKLNNMESVLLQENQALQVPIREGQSLQGGE